MIERLTLLALVGMPFAAGAACLYLGHRRAGTAIRVSVAAALAVVVLVSVATVDIEIPLVANRALTLKATAQLGIQLLGLAMLGFVMSLIPDQTDDLVGWLAVAWLSLGGLALALMITALPVALLSFVGSTILWAFALPEARRAQAAPSMVRFTALLALATPLLLIAFRLAESRTTATPSIERMVLALAVPAFALLVGVIPLHAWVLSLSSNTPREMLFGILLVVETAGFGLLLRVLAAHPWIVGEARDALVIGGALSALLGGWMALASPRRDPDDWLVYATVANSGIILAGLGTRSLSAGVGVALFLFARVLALVVLALAPRVGGVMRRLAYAAGTLALAGTPGLAGFPGLWLIIRRLQIADHSTASLAILMGSGLLFATAVRRWQASEAGVDGAWPVEDDPGARRAVLSLIALMIVIGLAPQLIADAFASAMRDLYFPAE